MATTPTGRDLTEQALEDAALRLLARDGVLSGLNLREVADEAGVNRGLVYHYFGSRQQLLRAALRRNTRQRLASIMAFDEPNFVKRMSRRFQAIVAHRAAMRLLALLWLDNDPRVRLVYAKDQTVPELREGLKAGLVAPGVEPEALQVALNALILGYALFREAYAKEMKLSVNELDRGVEGAMMRMVFRPEVLAAAGAPEPADEKDGKPTDRMTRDRGRRVKDAGAR